jgi:hypothetical protein
MLIHTYAQDVDLDATLKLDGWAATPPIAWFSCVAPQVAASGW